MMEVLRADFKKIPSVLSGEFGVVELPPAFTEPAKAQVRASKKPQPEKSPQKGLF